MVLIAHCLASITVEIATKWVAALLPDAPLVALVEAGEQGLELINGLVEIAELWKRTLYLIRVVLRPLLAEFSHFICKLLIN